MPPESAATPPTGPADLSQMAEGSSPVSASRQGTEAALDRLARISRIMRLVAIAVLPILLLALITTALGWSISQQMRFAEARPYPGGVGLRNDLSTLHLYRILALCLSGWGIFAVTWFEMLRKRGDALFEEISNELQWHLIRSRRGDSPPSAAAPDAGPDKPNIDQRIILRTFAQASDLPLVPGQYGPAIYGLIFLIVGIASFAAFPA